MRVKCHTVKKVWGCDAFQIMSCTLNDVCQEIILNDWGNFSVKDGSCILDVNKDYVLDIEYEEYKGRAGYRLINIPSLELSNIDDITESKELEILNDITTKSQANNIHKAYPNFVKMVLKGETDDIDINKIYNVGEYRLNVYINEINSKYKYYHIIDSLKEYGLTLKDCKDLCNEYTEINRILDVFKSNPYMPLIDVCHKSFARVDDVIIEAHPEFRVSKERTEYAILDVLNANEYEGSTYMGANEMAGYINGLDPDLLKLVKDTTMDSMKIHYFEEDKSVAKMDTYLAEVRMAQFVEDKLIYSEEWSHIDYTRFRNIDGFDLTDAQLKALENLCKYNISLLVGYSGTGKSSSMKGVINMLEEYGYDYILLAPTGKAAKRLAESTNRDAYTMHRAINQFEGLYQDVIIVDEFSFFCTEWNNMLISSIMNEDAKILFVGDNAQLNPISCGKVLQDLIDSKKIPMTMLTEVFRYGEGGISMIAEDLRLGKCNLTDEPIQKFGKDYTFINTENIKEAVITEYTKLLDKGVKPNDITCISPFNVGETGCFEINRELQSIINPIKPKEHYREYELVRGNRKYKVTLHKGDYVMNIVNNYNAIPFEVYDEAMFEDVDVDDIPEDRYVSVYNGDCGTIVSCDKDKIVVDFGDNLIVYTDNIRDLILCMVVTTHKVQGSQNKYIINISSTEHQKMLTRNLLYVANTRATKQHIEIGSPSAISKALLIEENKNRRTKLSNLLKGVTS